MLAYFLNAFPYTLRIALVVAAEEVWKNKQQEQQQYYNTKQSGGSKEICFVVCALKRVAAENNISY